MLAGNPISFRAFSIASVASPSEPCGARLNEIVTTGNCPWWLIASGVRSRFESRERAQRNLRSVRRVHVNILQRIRILLEARIHFHHHVVLIELRENRRHLPLAKRVVQRIVDVRRENAQPRSRIAVDRQRRQQTVIQLVCGHVAQLRQEFSAWPRISASSTPVPSGPHLPASTDIAFATRGLPPSGPAPAA